ncbi:MAG: radical SAM protein, partial [Desulfobacca sp.]|nr:radical SAM protein [Desulfobacca sp.]
METFKYKNIKQLVQIWGSFRREESRPPYFPTRLWIELTSQCNLRCLLCPNQSLSKEDKGFMSSELFKEIVDQVSHKVHDLYLFHRGESLLHPRVAEFITYAQTKGIPCKIHTNATRLSASLSKEILTAGLEVLSFSLDGYQAALYEKNRYPA